MQEQQALIAMNLDNLPNIDTTSLRVPSDSQLEVTAVTSHKPRILLLYGSLREVSFSRYVVEESARLLQAMGCETRIYSPAGLPLPDDGDPAHPKVIELHELMTWSEGQVWCSPERHGSMTAIMKAQLDWVPLTLDAVRPTQ